MCTDEVVSNIKIFRRYTYSQGENNLACYHAFALVCCSCTFHTLSVHIHCVFFFTIIYALALCRRHLWWSRITNQVMLSPRLPSLYHVSLLGVTKWSPWYTFNALCRSIMNKIFGIKTFPRSALSFHINRKRKISEPVPRQKPLYQKKMSILLFY